MKSKQTSTFFFLLYIYIFWARRTRDFLSLPTTTIFMGHYFYKLLDFHQRNLNYLSLNEEIL